MTTVSTLSHSDLQKYCPVFYFHPNEPYFPISYDEYLQYSSLVQYQSNGRPLKRLCDETLTQQRLSELIAQINSEHPETNWSYIGLAPRLPCPLETMPFQPKAPIYVNVAEEGDYYLVHYILFYYFNQGKINDVGWHFSDCEHVTLRFYKSDLSTPYDIYFSRHGTHEGQYRLWSECVKDEQDANRPCVYVACGAHGCYSEPGERVIVRLFGFGNDETSDRGIVWRTGQIVVLQDTDQTQIPFSFVHSDWNSLKQGFHLNDTSLYGDNRFLLFRGNWGRLSVGTPNTQSWWDKSADVEKSDQTIPSKSQLDWDIQKYMCIAGAAVVGTVLFILLAILFVRICIRISGKTTNEKMTVYSDGSTEAPHQDRAMSFFNDERTPSKNIVKDKKVEIWDIPLSV